MEKLELKYLAPYLPYGLKISIEGRGINLLKGLQDDNDTIHSVGKTPIRFCRPILRPLSDLTKEIEVDGEKFVPMVKLLTFCEQNIFYADKDLHNNSEPDIISCKHNYYDLIESHEYQVKYVVHTSNMGDLVYSFTYDPELRRFSTRDETHKRPLGIGFQFDLFQKLFEWHFDVFGLIEKGLAIDINTI